MKRKVLNSALIFMVVFSVFTLSMFNIAMATDDGAVFEEAFTENNTVEKLSADGWTTSGVVSLTDDLKGVSDSKSLLLSPGAVTSSIATKALSQNVTNGKYEFSFDISLSKTGDDSKPSNTRVSLGDSSTGNIMGIIRFGKYDENIYLLEESLGETVAYNTLYRVEVTVDMDNSAITAVVKDSAGTKLFSKTKNELKVINSTNDFTVFNQIVITSFATEAKVNINLDNLKLSVAKEEEEEEEQTYGAVFEEAFTENNTVDKLAADGWSKDGAISLTDDLNGDSDSKSLLLSPGAVTSSAATKTLSKKMEDGKFEFSFDISLSKTGDDSKPSNTRVSLGDSSTGNIMGIIRFGKYDENIYLLEESAGQTVAYDTLYHIEVTVDMDNSAITAVVKDSAGTKLFSKTKNELKVVNSTADFTAFNQVIFTSFATEAKVNINLDNVRLKYASVRPELNKASLKAVRTDNTEQTDLTRLSPATSKIAFGIGTAVDITTLTNEKIYIQEKGSGVKTAQTLKIEGTVITVKLPNMLEADKTYELIITDGLKSTDGLSAIPAAVELKTLPSEISVNYGDLKIGGTAITDVSQMISGKSLSMDISCINTTGEAVNGIVIFAYNSGLLQIGVTVDKESLKLGAEDRYVTRTVTSVVPTFDGGKTPDELCVLFWDGINTLVPICKSYSFSD